MQLLNHKVCQLVICVALTMLGALPAIAANAASRSDSPEVERAFRVAKEWLYRFETGKVDRQQLGATVNQELTGEMIRREGRRLRAFGRATRFTFLGSEPIDDVVSYDFRIMFADGMVIESIAFDNTGKIAGIDFRTFVPTHRK
jgi:hypothetical protein